MKRNRVEKRDADEGKQQSLISDALMSTETSSNSNASGQSKRIKRSKLSRDNQIERVKCDQSRWRNRTEQQIYSTKLVQSLRQAHQNNSQVTPLAVREIADRILAVSAKGLSRWSRAILRVQHRLKMRKLSNKHTRPKKKKVTSNIPSANPAVKKRMPALQKKLRILGQLIPGCSKLSFPNLIEEATDYISALEMQVRAMTALTGLLIDVESVTPPSEWLSSKHS